MVVDKLIDMTDLVQVIELRKKVCIMEYGVSILEETDDYDVVSEVFRVFDSQGELCGTARWRFDEVSILIDQVAVLPGFNHTNLVFKLIEELLSDLKKNPHTRNYPIRLYSLPQSLNLYKEFGFVDCLSIDFCKENVLIPLEYFTY